MSIKKVSIALASVLVMAAGVPAFAQTINTSGTSQSNIQTSNVDGNRNATVNNSSQRASTVQSGRRTDNEAATIQKNDQLINVDGNRNGTINNNDQRSVTRQSR
jgi:hypothetical protein